MRGRVIAILMGIGLGSTPIGAPLVGWVADTFGPRWSLTVGATACYAAALVGWLYFRNARDLAAPTPVVQASVAQEAHH
jgi:MFS family permease